MSTASGPISEGGGVAPGATGTSHARPPLTVLELLTLLSRHRRFLAKAALAGAVCGLALAFLLPTQYTAVTTILPSGSSSSLASAFAAQSGELGFLASIAGGGLGFHNPAEICLLMLRSRSVEDAVVQRFELMKEYHEKRLSDTRTALERHTSVTLNLKTGIIAISAQDRDPARAAELANGYVDEFRKFSSSLAITEASQRRMFFEQQLLEATGGLNQADNAFKNTQQSTGMLDPVSATKADLESAVAVRDEIASKQVQLRTMRTYSTEQNPALVRVRQEIAGLETQLAELTGTNHDVADDPLVPKDKIPEAGSEYLHRLRDVKYNETVVAVLARQLEIARLDEARQGPAMQIVDPAVTPDKRSSPKRAVILLASTMLAICAASLWVIYVKRESIVISGRMAGNTAALLLLLLASAPFITAQTQETQQQSGDCATSTNNSLDNPCTTQDQSAPGFAAGTTNLNDRAQTAPDSMRDRRELREDQDNTANPRDGANRDRRGQEPRPPQPHTEFEQMVADSAGRPLAVFGHSLFAQPPETFAPVAGAQVPSDYVIGPGDELRIHIWGQIDADLRTEVDRSGQIYIPKVGEVSVTGVHYGELESYLKHTVEGVFKSFSLTVAIGRLHSIQIFVVGQAKAPGVYTISSLSTLINAVFASGGPSPQGSLRHIQLRRSDRIVQEFDLYDLLMKGDKSHDVQLQSGDVVFIPAVGPLVGVTGSVNTPAIYELRDGVTLGKLIETAGGLNAMADGTSATIERIGDNQARTVLQFPLDAAGLAFAVKGGDIVHVSSIVPRFDNTITLRGYVANPGRFPFVPGMHVRDLLPNAQALLPREYWLNRASTTDARQTEYPVRKQIQETHRSMLSTNQDAAQNSTLDAAEAGTNQQQPQVSPQPETGASSQNGEQAGEQSRIQSRTQTRTQSIPDYYSDLRRSETITDQETERAQRETGNTSRQSDQLTRELLKLVPSINWRYALIQRVDAVTLKTQLVPFDLGKAVIDADPASNMALQPGDIVTVFSDQDIVAPQASQTRYVKVEGEVEHPGIYELAEGQTLIDLLQTAGGLTTKSYPYGARLTRESARVEQQRGLDEMVRTAEAETRASQVAAVASSSDAGSVAAGEAAQRSLLASLRSIRATGRVVLAMSPDATSIADFPPMVLEDGDRIVIPARSNTVTVSGAVYNPASFVYDARRKVGDYLQLAGKGALNSNQGHAFVLRADGSVISRQEAGGWFHSGFDQLPMHPGDQIVVPEKVDNGVVRAIRDWGQLISPLALTTLAISSVVN
jgi:protein involved in polysaccharide export with SLBB domain/capsule polysaccharide export protein KpsE/RkpR